MKIVIDIRPKKDGQGPSGFIRLYPETKEEMADLQWLLDVFRMRFFESNSGTGGSMMFSVCFQEEP